MFFQVNRRKLTYAQYTNLKIIGIGKTRPVSVLPAISKAHEMEIESENSNFFHDIFSPFLSAFRKMYNCQSALMHLVESWKRALDRGEKCFSNNDGSFKSS